jgi:hypothetical protein
LYSFDCFAGSTQATNVYFNQLLSFLASERMNLVCTGLFWLKEWLIKAKDIPTENMIIIDIVAIINEKLIPRLFSIFGKTMFFF